MPRRPGYEALGVAGAADAVARLLEHADARVVANAVDALAAIGRGRADADDE